MKSYTGGIRHDYKDSSPRATADSRRGWSWFALGLCVPLTGVALLLISETNESKVPDPPTAALARVEPMPVIGPADGPIALRLPPAEMTRLSAPSEVSPLERSAALSRGEILDVTIAAGDTLERVFRRNGLSAGDLAAMTALPEAAPHLAKLIPGNEIRIVHEGSRVLSLSRELSLSEELWINRGETGFNATRAALDLETRVVGARGTIETSLFEAGVAAGLSDNVTLDMAGIFQWDIDFIQDVRTGDSFTVVYEELWRDGIKLADGDIVATEFINRGTRYRAARYVDGAGQEDYYTPEGRSVRKAFIRAPVEFTRISSNFNPNRRHPVLNTIRAHRGVDYAAPTGTPVMAAGDGKIISRGVNGGYGNAVVIQHGGNITTLYGHLSRFGRHGNGSRVRQGDIIGYVGQSGLATGPHLHYEYRLAGVHRNPRTVSLPPADPVPAEYHDDFVARTAQLWRQLDLYERTRFASLPN